MTTNDNTISFFPPPKVADALKNQPLAARMRPRILDVIDRTPDVVKQVHAMIPKGFPDQIADLILDGIKAFTGRLKADLSS